MYIKSAALATILLATGSQVDAFGAPMKTRHGAFGKLMVPHRTGTSSAFHLSAPATRSMPTTTTTQLSATTIETESEVVRLRTMAAKLRAEAASMEAEKAQEQADTNQRLFAKFDTNLDGQVSLDELKAGLEKAWKQADLQVDRVEQLMETFDVSGDGALQVDEFVSVNRFRSRLESTIREEKVAAKELQRQALADEEAAQLAKVRTSLINDGEPSNTDKLVSTLPYLLPLLDGLSFGRYFVEGHEANPAVTVLAIFATLYRSIPFGGLIAFFGLRSLPNNLKINRLVRFNAEQAINLDIALFVPGLIASLSALAGGSLGLELPAGVSEIGSDAVFVALVATIGYSVMSSLVGVAPDKVPGISEYVNQRMPTIDMFDAEGRFVPPTPPGSGNENENENDE
jgi:hypothetical protein